jgi:PAS domain S-box-containing protein
MNDHAQRLAERRVLILAPTGRDAPMARDVLAEEGIRGVVCADVAELADGIVDGAGAVVVAEEALLSELHVQHLGERVARQPPWSDLPILLLTHPGADSSTVRMAVRQLGNVTLLERPVRVASLRTAAQSALRARHRQLMTREHLHELDHVARALRESEARLQALISNAAVGMAEIAPDGRFAIVNDALCRILGEKREDLVGMPLARLAHADDRGDIEGLLEALFSRRHPTFAGERRFVRSDGEIIWAKVSIALAGEGAAGDARGVAVIEDVTERKHAEEDLREADRRKDEFLAVLAHELRNPLAPIRNALHILRLSQSPGIEKIVNMMERQVQHMVRLVDDLLEVSRISRGRIELKRERADLASILRGAIDTSRPLIDAAHHKLETQLPAAGEMMLEADVVRLSQVFANLLNNAAKYTPAGGLIRLEVEAAGGTATVRVKDNGEGIPASMLSRVFNMFTQINTGSRAQGGLGIGLTLARTLVHLHGGSIEAYSEGPDRGCEITVKLPLAERDPLTAPPPSPAMPVDRPLERQKVLVVDDNRDAADSLGLLLQFLGAEVQVVHGGHEALAAMREFQPRVVLLDLGMPNMDGLEVARRMREDPQMRTATLVALTGWGQSEDRRRTGEAGFDYHLVKPADVRTLRSILAVAPQGETVVRH